MRTLKLKGKLEVEYHANDYVFKVPTLGGEDLGGLLKKYEGVIVSLSVKPILSICPKCGSGMRHVSNMWLCSRGDFSYYEEQDGTLKFV